MMGREMLGELLLVVKAGFVLCAIGFLLYAAVLLISVWHYVQDLTSTIGGRAMRKRARPVEERGGPRQLPPDAKPEPEWQGDGEAPTD